mgnify:CR=1 FL=1
MDDAPVEGMVAPIIMGGLGPDAQHSFFQQIHQGVPKIPVEFYIVLGQQSGGDLLLKT